jgi:hypothetical protein
MSGKKVKSGSEMTDLEWALETLEKLMALCGITLTKKSRERLERLRNESRP